MTAPIVFIDTETTSLRPDRRAWEIAMIRRDASGERELTLQVVDVDLSNADPMALKVGGFYDRAFGYAPCTPSKAERTGGEASAARYIERWTRDAHLVGVGVEFDAGTLDPMLRRHGLAPAWHYSLIDLKAMAVGWLAAKAPGNLWGIPPWAKSDELAKTVGIYADGDHDLTVDPGDRHTAMGDARWAMRWYDAMTGSRP